LCRISSHSRSSRILSERTQLALDSQSSPFHAARGPIPFTSGSKTPIPKRLYDVLKDSRMVRASSPLAGPCVTLILATRCISILTVLETHESMGINGDLSPELAPVAILPLTDRCSGLTPLPSQERHLLPPETDRSLDSQVRAMGGGRVLLPTHVKCTPWHERD
jgi:hypothetical protein